MINKSAFVAKSYLAMLLTSSVMAPCISPAFAQADAAGQPVARPAPPASEVEPAPGEITVTARRRSELQRDVPLAISSMTGDQLVSANISNVRDLVISQPSVYFAYGSVAPFTLVRGFGSGSNASFDQAVGKFVDNVAYNRDQDARIPFFDVERLEVLKGPQVLLYGASATAGAINITTKKPGDRFEGDASVSYEFNNNEVLMQGGVTVPLAPIASLRVAGYLQHLNKGWVHNDTLGTDDPRDRNFAARGTLGLTPTPDLKIFLKGEYARIRQRGGILQPYVQTVVPAVAFPEVKLDDHMAATNSGLPFGNPEFVNMTNRVAQADLEWNAGGATIASTTAYRRSQFRQTVDADGSALALFGGTPVSGYKQFSQEVRAFGTAGQLDYMVGGYYEWNKLNFYNPSTFNLKPLGSTLPVVGRIYTLDRDTRVFSGYAELTYHFSPEFSLEGGLRYSDIKREGDQTAFAYNVLPGSAFWNRAQIEAQRNTALNGAFSAFGGAPHELLGLSSKEHHWQPQVTLQYKPNTDLMLYARYVKGAKAGGFDATYALTSRAGASFRPEEAESFEAGIKGVTANRKLEFSLDLFRTTFTDLQVSVFDGVAAFIVSNVGKARTQGAEASMIWRPANGLSVSAEGALLDAKYLSFPGVACYYALTIITPAGQVCRQDLSGETTPMSSKYTFGAHINYEHDAFGSLRMTESVEILGRSGFKAGTINDPLQYQSGFAQINAQFGIRSADHVWELSLFGRNLTDKQYKEFAAQSVITNGGKIAAISRGRQIGLRLATRF